MDKLLELKSYLEQVIASHQNSKTQADAAAIASQKQAAQEADYVVMSSAILDKVNQMIQG